MRDQPLPLSVMGKLPATSYVRMVDIWLIFTQLVPFIEETNFALNAGLRPQILILLLKASCFVSHPHMGGHARFHVQ